MQENELLFEGWVSDRLSNMKEKRAEKKEKKEKIKSINDKYNAIMVEEYRNISTQYKQILRKHQFDFLRPTVSDYKDIFIPSSFCRIIQSKYSFDNYTVSYKADQINFETMKQFYTDITEFEKELNSLIKNKDIIQLKSSARFINGVVDITYYLAFNTSVLNEKIAKEREMQGI